MVLALAGDSTMTRLPPDPADLPARRASARRGAFASLGAFFSGSPGSRAATAFVRFAPSPAVLALGIL